MTANENVKTAEGAWDRLWEELLALEAMLGDSPLGESRMSVRAADLKEVLSIVDARLLGNDQRRAADEALALLNSINEQGGQITVTFPNGLTQ